MQITKIMLIRPIFKALIFVTSLAIIACTPKFDWRTVRADDLMYEALYPSKPSRAEKSIQFEGERLSMTMEAAKAGNALYAIGSIHITPNQKVDVGNLLQYLQHGMLANLKADVEAKSEAVTVKTAGQPSYELPAQSWSVVGIAPDGQRRLLKVWLVQRKFPDGQTWVYQLSVLQQLLDSDSQAVNVEEQAMFFSGFKPY
jgi:hypothetical protein